MQRKKKDMCGCGTLMKSEGREQLEERDWGEGGEGKYWGMIMIKLYCYILHMYEYVAVNPTII